MKYHEKLDEVRKKRRFTLRKLALESGIDASHLSRVVMGYDIPTEEEHKKLNTILRYNNRCRRMISEKHWKSKTINAYVMYIISCINRKHRDVGENASGSLICPICYKHIVYMYNAENGHSWGKCQTEDCIGWMM